MMSHDDDDDDHVDDDDETVMMKRKRMPKDIFKRNPSQTLSGTMDELFSSSLHWSPLPVEPGQHLRITPTISSLQ